LIPLPLEEACRRLERELPLFEPSVYDEHRAALRHLAEGGAYELRYGTLEEAVDLLESIVS
jgi:hypothetical protein